MGVEAIKYCAGNVSKIFQVDRLLLIEFTSMRIDYSWISFKKLMNSTQFYISLFFSARCSGFKTIASYIRDGGIFVNSGGQSFAFASSNNIER
jgi:hypothetical protein